MTSTFFFPFAHKNTGLKQTIHWGPLESAWILRHFWHKGIDIPDVVKDVVGFGCETTQELRMKKRNATLDGFQELLTDCVLIYEGAVVAILLHEFVPSNQAVEYFAMMAYMWQFDRHVTRTCSPETKMAMFGHKFCYKDCVPTRWASKSWTYCSHFPSFFPWTNLLIFDLSSGSSITSETMNPFSRTRRKI